MLRYIWLRPYIKLMCNGRMDIGRRLRYGAGFGPPTLPE